MAKGIGLIGNFKGKVGNTVGYKLSASNTGNTQGIRIYQPIVRNPKTSAQAEQRAKLAPINATYRALKMVIDRGNEGLPYGNKSRLAWLKQALKATKMPWFVKGASVNYPVVCQLTKGSLSQLPYRVVEDEVEIPCPSLKADATVNTVGGVSTALMADHSFLKAGDQITVVLVKSNGDSFYPTIFSFVLDTKSAETISGFKAGEARLKITDTFTFDAAAIIISREGDNGEHLRSTTSLAIDSSYLDEIPYNADSKAAAIASYMSSASTNADWAEESIQ